MEDWMREQVRVLLSETEGRDDAKGYLDDLVGECCETFGEQDRAALKAKFERMVDEA